MFTRILAGAGHETGAEPSTADGRDTAAATATGRGRRAPRRYWWSRLVVLCALGLMTPAAAAADSCAEALGDCLWNAMVWDVLLPGVGDQMELECLAGYTSCLIRMLLA